MARTAASRRLTQQHRRAQIAFGATSALVVRHHSGLLELGRLDATAAVWIAVMTSQLATRWRRSQVMATSYLQRYQRMELGPAAETFVARPTLNVAMAERSMLYAGPVFIKQLLATGRFTPEQAYASAMSNVTGRLQTWTLAGGRQTVMQTAVQDRRGGRFRRVSDGQPCAFCAMLVVRSIEWPYADPTFEAHHSCGCTAEVVYPDADGFYMSDLESDWIGAYQRASTQARAAGEAINSRNVLARMRRSYPDLFHDGIPTP